MLLLYLSTLTRLIRNAQTAADLPETLIMMGIVVGLTYQIAVNAGMVTSFNKSTGILWPL
jgi:rod shape determining protein RodA